MERKYVNSDKAQLKDPELTPRISEVHRCRSRQNLGVRRISVRISPNLPGALSQNMKIFLAVILL